MRAVFGLVLVVGLGLAGFAVYMVQGYFQQQNAALARERAVAAQQVPTVEVYAVNRVVQYGEQIKPEDVVLIRGDEVAHAPVNRIVPVDATGAGDMFAAGFLYGMATGQGLATAGRMGCIAATEVISHFGARPETDLKRLFARDGLI